MQEIFKKLELLAKEFYSTDCVSNCDECPFSEKLMKYQYDIEESVDMCEILTTMATGKHD